MPEEEEYEIEEGVGKKEETIEIDNDLLRDKLKFALGRELRGKELENFREYVEIDAQQWITDNAKAFVRR